MILSRDQVRHVLYVSGFRGADLETAVLISECESGFDTNAHALTDREDSRGLMQINVYAHPQWISRDLFDPYINGETAYQLYSSRGGSFQDWTCLNMINPPVFATISPIILVGGLALLMYLILD